MTISFGTPTGSACIAPAPISPPSAPPRQSAPSSRPSAYRRRQTARTPASMRSTAAPREPAARTPVELVAGRGGDLRVRDVGA